MKKNVGVIGSGGREHAIAWKLAQSENVGAVYCFPGNGGTQLDDKVWNIQNRDGSSLNREDLHRFITEKSLDYVVVGPEGPLAEGIVDYFNGRGYSRMFGPVAAGAAIEGDKFFSHDIMRDSDVPQAESVKCFSVEEAKDAVRMLSAKHKVVLKARGLHAGKGVYVCGDGDDPILKLEEHIRTFGPEVLVAERLYGEEFSVFGISDGKQVIPFILSAQDHKPLLTGDLGPNTGGMGAYCPAPVADAGMVNKVVEHMMNPVVEAMRTKHGVEYKGFLYAGMILTPDNGLKVIEFNCRLGDPETQPLMMMLESDLDSIICKALDGSLSCSDIQFKKGAAVCVVMASNGYPGSYEKGYRIGGLNDPDNLDVPGIKVFHAGTKAGEPFPLTFGGRVLGVTSHIDYATDRSPERDVGAIRQARQSAYDALHAIDDATTVLNARKVFIYRRDIADRAVGYGK